jgi:unsaturated chondroitin disaccharide hydrolase
MDKQLNFWIDDCLEKAVDKIKASIYRLGNKIPYIAYDGIYTDVVEERGIDWWTNGFWSGILWQAYHYTDEIIFFEKAKQQENRLMDALSNFRDVHHDVGFLFLPSAVAHYRKTKDEQSFYTGLHAANLLAGRFNIDGNYIVAWNDDKPGWMIIDSMMNLPLLYWASAVTGDPRFYKIAERHAETTARFLVRPNGTTGHIACFDPENGSFIQYIAGQGYSANSAWSRGHAWALYGFILSYRHTQKTNDLLLAKELANSFIRFVKETGYIPKADFLTPENEQIFDTSAGLCAVCGLLELSNWVIKEEKEYYKSYAIKILQAIVSEYADWNTKSDGIIGGATEAYHRYLTQNVHVIYSDYFFFEALLRLKEKHLFIW